MDLVKKLFGKDDTRRGDKHYRQAKAIYDKGSQGLTKYPELDESIALSRKAREEFHSAKPGGSLNEAYALNLEASIHRLRLDYEKAIARHDEAMAIVDKVDPHSVLKAQFLNNLAELHRAKYNRGEIGFLLSDKLGSGYHGNILIEALKYALSAVEEYKARHPTNSGFIFSVHTLGLVCGDFGDFGTAEVLLQMSSALAAAVGDGRMADLSLSCYQDIRTAEQQLRSFNLLRDRAFEYLSDSQKREAEELLAKAKVVSDFKK